MQNVEIRLSCCRCILRTTIALSRMFVLYEAIKHNLIIEEYTPLQVKKAITWNGQADKNQLKNAIKILFWL